MSSDDVRNMMHGAVEHGGFGDVFVLCDLRPDSEARQFFKRFRADLPFDAFDPLRPSPSAMITNPTIGMARHDPNGPMLARSGGGLTI